MGHGNAAANATAKGGKRDGKPEGREGRGAHRYSPYTNWQQVYEQLAEANPDYKQIFMFPTSYAQCCCPVFGNQRGTDRYKFNPRNGEITETTLYKDLDNSGKIREKTDYGTDGNRTDSSILCICIPGLSARDTNDGAGSS